MTDSTDVSDVKMTRFGNRVYLFRKRHVRVKDEAKIASRGTDWDDSTLPLIWFYREENLTRFLQTFATSCTDFSFAKE